MQIFVYKTGIDNNNNYPMIDIDEEEIINLIEKFDYSQNINSETPYFVINNIQSIPNIDLDEYVIS